MNLPWQLGIALLCALMLVPALFLGFELAALTHSLWLMPVPVVICFGFGCWALHAAEEAVS